MIDPMLVVFAFILVESGSLAAAGAIWHTKPIDRFKSWANTTLTCVIIALLMLCTWSLSSVAATETAFGWSAAGLLVLNVCLMLAWWRAWIMASRAEEA